MRETLTLRFGVGDEELFTAAQESARDWFLGGVVLGYSVQIGPAESGEFIALLVDYDSSTDAGCAARDEIALVGTCDPRYTLTPLGAAMLEGKK